MKAQDMAPVAWEAMVASALRLVVSKGFPPSVPAVAVEIQRNPSP